MAETVSTAAAAVIAVVAVVAAAVATPVVVVVAGIAVAAVAAPVVVVVAVAAANKIINDFSLFCRKSKFFNRRRFSSHWIKSASGYYGTNWFNVAGLD